jgi:UDP-glucose 4-epimerase
MRFLKGGRMSLKDLRVLITGSSGFVGKHLNERLRKKKVDVVTFDRVDGDITNWDDVKKILPVDVIFHLAAITFVPLSFENPRLTYFVNTVGTLNILELCRKKDIDKMIYTSSYIYGIPKYLPIDENHPPDPNNPYSSSKFLGEKLCEAYSRDYGINCVILRPFNVFGKRQDPSFLIPTIVNQMLEGNKIILNDPEPKRDLLYVEDLVDAYLKALEYPKHDIFNIGSGKSYSVREIVKLLLRLNPKKVEVDYLNKRRKNEIMDVVADIDKARKKLNWSPKTSLEEGLAKILEDKV